MRSTLTILALLLSTTASAADLSGNEAAAMLRKIQKSTAAANHPQEYQSFATTIILAKKMLQDGDQRGAAQLFSLARLKGEILFERLKDEAAPPPSRPAPLFSQLSSTGKVLTLLPPPQIELSPLVSAEEPLAAEAKPALKLSARIIGGEGIYLVKRKESLRLVASRLGVRLRDLARVNRLKRDATVTAGQSLHYNNRRIAPKAIKNGIVVNIPDRSLYLFRNGRVAANYPVALGISKKGESTIWRTPTGKFRIVDKKENPAWRIPPSIQKEMEENGEEAVVIVPPGPKNPLGKYALRTTLAGILIHSTTRPASINSYSSHGCIRVMPEHMKQLFRAVTIPMDGEIIYQPIKVEVTSAGKVFLEVDNDYYERIEDLAAEVTRTLQKYHATNRVSWQKVARLVREKTGIAEDVTLAAIPD